MTDVLDWFTDEYMIYQHADSDRSERALRVLMMIGFFSSPESTQMEVRLRAHKRWEAGERP